VNRGFALAAVAIATATALPARADVTFRYNGSVESDLRFAVPGKDGPEDVPDLRFIRSENWARFTGKLDVGWDVRAVADVQLAFIGQTDVEKGPELISRSAIDPFRIESDAIFVEILDLATEGLDLRLGRQILRWGTGDQFNPTTNMNPLDVEDRIKFGERIANEMIVLSYTPPIEVEADDEDDAPVMDEINITVAVAPFFRPSQLPSSALLAFDDRTQFRRLANSDQLAPLFDQEELFVGAGGSVTYDVNVDTPPPEFENVQVGARLAWAFYGIDMSVSWYHGFDDIPRAEKVYASNLTLPAVPTVPLTDIGAALGSLDLSGVSIDNEIHLVYPRKDVIGADFSTSLDFLGGMGLWAEFAWTIHDDLYRFTRTSAVFLPGGIEVPGIEERILEREHAKGGFFKLVVGLDYTIQPWWYVNVQYLHGFPDEFGADNLNDYFVAGSDFKMFKDQVLLRLFAIVQVQDQSTVLYPQLSFMFWQNTEIMLGALAYTGDADSKFGNRITGPNTVFMRGKLYF
jgi:hypothetical protein